MESLVKNELPPRKGGKSFAEWVFHLFISNAPSLIASFCFFRALLVKRFQDIAMWPLILSPFSCSFYKISEILSKNEQNKFWKKMSFKM